MHTLLAILTIFFLQFTDKVGSDRVCLSPLAQQMRLERGIAIDSLDYAVSPLYLDSIKAIGASVIHTSRWMNGATLEATEQQIETIRTCRFVKDIQLTKCEPDTTQEASISRIKNKVETSWNTPSQMQEKASDIQLKQLGLNQLHAAGYRGAGIRMGIADGGFYMADSMPSIPQDRCLGYMDLTDDEDYLFRSASKHGTLCLSAIVGQMEDFQGAAPEVEYFLFRTEEYWDESLKEIDNWVTAIEMADSLGLHIVSTSLGYSTFDDEASNFTYEQMDGRYSRGAQAATIATRKGMLLVVAAGNDGNKAWHYISTPADADSILTVGAVDAEGIIAEFSSFGPTADGRVKPEVCAMGKGTALINPSDNTVQNSNGTSFACPLIAGMAACLWSAMPQASNMEIRERIIRSADRYTQAHEQYGYGIPNAWAAYQGLTTSTPCTLHPTPYTKILYNGQLYILHNGNKYDLLGNKIY